MALHLSQIPCGGSRPQSFEARLLGVMFALHSYALARLRQQRHSYRHAQGGKKRIHFAWQEFAQTLRNKSARMFLIRSFVVESDPLWMKRTTKLGREINCRYVLTDARVARKKKLQLHYVMTKLSEHNYALVRLRAQRHSYRHAQRGKKRTHFA